MFNDPKVQAYFYKRVAERERERKAIEDMNREWLLIEIDKLRTVAMENGDLNCARGCLELHGRVISAFVDVSKEFIELKQKVMTKAQKHDAHRLAGLLLDDVTKGGSDVIRENVSVEDTDPSDSVICKENGESGDTGQGDEDCIDR
jgi:hypothetical protein